MEPRRRSEREHFGKTQARPRVFVVDDDKATAASLALILCLEGFEATYFTGRRSPELCQSQTPQLLISSAGGTQDDSGIELATRLRESCPIAKCCCTQTRYDARSVDAARTAGHQFDTLASLSSRQWCPRRSNLSPGAHDNVAPGHICGAALATWAFAGDTPRILFWGRILPVKRESPWPVKSIPHAC